MNNAREKAKELARHYFRLLAKAAGVRWTEDNDGEIAALVDAIIAAAQADGRQGDLHA